MQRILPCEVPTATNPTKTARGSCCSEKLMALALLLVLLLLVLLLLLVGVTQSF